MLKCSLGQFTLCVGVRSTKEDEIEITKLKLSNDSIPAPLLPGPYSDLTLKLEAGRVQREINMYGGGEMISLSILVNPVEDSQELCFYFALSHGNAVSTSHSFYVHIPEAPSGWIPDEGGDSKCITTV